ncbi:MAG: amino acid adenylation domain-containing protein, partial [Acidobacteria bacterium]|nr:amino acid adenylation domain-containing protein [Acidobacteriota bacterium]
SSCLTSYLPNFLTSHPFSLAYIIYTSGSTGNPKGVPITHANFSPLVHWGYRNMGITETDRFLQNLSYFFDWSAWEIFLALTTGAELYITDEEILLDGRELNKFINQNKITVLHITPSQFQILVGVEANGKVLKLESLKHLCLGAEKLTYDLLKRSMAIVPGDCRIYNMYGPTEATIIAALLEINRDTVAKYENLGSVPIGIPVGNGRLYIVDRYFNLCPPRVTGQLIIGGEGLSKGYINNPELTAERFIVPSATRDTFERAPLDPPKLLPNSHSPTTNHQSPIYKTGDLARWLPEGVVEFLGRIDHQVKIRGYRIELGEIENKILAYQGVKAAVVILVGDTNLCAYIVPEGQVENEVAFKKDLKEYLTRGLPGYMVPSFIVLIKSILLTPNGKVDLRALPRPELESLEEYLAPRDAVEEKLAEIWAGVLGKDLVKDRIGIDANFFELGGHSLKATVLASRIHKELNTKVPLAEIFKTPTIRGLAEFIRGTVEEIYESIVPVEEKEYYDLSFAQRRMYILQQIDLNSIAYNMPQNILLSEEFDLEKLEESFKKVIKRHESLRTSFHMIGDQLMQKVHREVDFKIETYELSNVHRFLRAFDLSCAPLLRVGMLKSAKSGNFLMVDIHHIISDGISSQVLKEDFSAFFEGKELPALRIQYKDFAQWQNSEKEKKNLEHQENYWLNEFAGELPVLELPTDYPRSVIQDFSGAAVAFEVDAGETQALKKIMLETGATLYMALLALYNVFLAKISGQEDIVLGTPTAGRRHPDLESVIGMFVNTLALRSYPTGGQTFKAFLGNVKSKTLEAFENQEYPFEELVEKARAGRDTGRNPLFDVVFSFQDNKAQVPKSTGTGEGREFTTGETPFKEEDPGKNETYQPWSQKSKFDITLFASESQSSNLSLAVEYGTKLFKKSTIQRFIVYMKRIITALTKEPETMLGQVEILSLQEKQELLESLNKVSGKYAVDKTLVQLFAEQAQRAAAHIAVIGGALEASNHEPGPLSTGKLIHLSYAELKRKSLALAHLLQAKGVIPNMSVGLMIDRSLSMTIGILGILQASGAYVPLNPKTPAARTRYILQESGARFVVTTHSLNQQIEENTIIYLEDSLNRQVTVPALQPGATPGNTAYVIFTSGSTGLPKGVPITHTNLSSLLHWGFQALGLGVGDRTLQNLAYYFDWSVWEIFITLTTGASLYVFPEEVILNPETAIALMHKHDITVLHVTPTQYGYLSRTNRETGTLKYLFIGAEKLTLDMVKNSIALLSPCCRVFNMYGPTEATIISAVLEIDRRKIHEMENLTSVPIGSGTGNTVLLVLDTYLKLCPGNITGELYIGGDGVAMGYLNNPELTMEKFIFSPNFLTSSLPNFPLYRSGDRVLRLADGNIEFLGRIDQQVKVRGYRIELAEIETALLKNREIKEAVVLTHEDKNGDKYLCAYLVGDAELSIPALRETLAKQLPDYMIPAYYVPLKEIPLTPNGKLDRNALPKPGFKKEEILTPRNEIEAKLVELWADILEIEKDLIGIDSDFFQLGGHSLKATILVSRISKIFNRTVPLIEIFKTPTIQSLAAYINASAFDTGAAKDEKPLLLKPGTDKTLHLFFIHDGTGEVDGYIEFCKHLSPGFHCWGLRADRLENLAPQTWTIETLAKNYIAMIKKVQPHGPYFIIGWSLG